MDAIFTIKHLNSDRQGYASDAYFEMQSQVEGNLITSSVCVSFGGEDLKPMSAWTQDAIDAYAETLRPLLEAQIAEQIEAAQGVQA